MTTDPGYDKREANAGEQAGVSIPEDSENETQAEDNTIFSDESKDADALTTDDVEGPGRGGD